MRNDFREARDDVDAEKMRYLGVQDDGYGASLAQDRLPKCADESMMAATGESTQDEAPKSEEKCIMSGLPLLLADGYPTSLNKMSLKQLECFIAFMIQCSLGHDTAKAMIKPSWWPRDMKFSYPLVRTKKTDQGWMANLQKLVLKCYSWHRSDYLLDFSTHLAQYPRDKLQYVNNYDSTTSLYLKSTGKLQVTFRNENMYYDRVSESPRRSLLSQNSSSCFASKSKPSQDSQSLVVIQPPSDEIYLCDNCDGEFVGLEKMKEHEKLCDKDIERTSTSSRSQTPNEVPPQSSIEIGQNQFLDYFGLFASGESGKRNENDGRSIAYNPTLLEGPRTSRRVRGSVNLTRSPSIPFSSPAGIAMAKKSKMMTEGTQQERLDRLERHLHAPALGKSARPKWLDRLVEYNRWVVSYKPNREKPIVEDTHPEYTHEYKFRSRRGKIALSMRSQLLYIACNPVYVSLERIGPKALAELKRDPSRYVCPKRRLKPRYRPRPRCKMASAVRRTENPIPSSLLVENKQRKASIGKSLNDFLSNNRDLTIREVLTYSPVRMESEFHRPHCDDLTIREVTTRSSGQLVVNSEKFNDLAEITVVNDGAQQPQFSSSPKIPNPEQQQPSPHSPIDSNILLVSLCSSDEETENPPSSCDENRDPLRTTIRQRDSNSRLSHVKNLTNNNKFRSRAFVHPADSSSDWLRGDGGVLTDDNDKGVSKCLGNVVLDNCTKLTPILKPTP